ncbi:MAG: biotin transporter BioY [Oscillospiraceae bacterium]|nr:biotin transporter BioY [Oscillospiraceae bacterium]
MKSKRLSVYDIAIISVFVAVISVCSFVTVPLAVPFTMQVFGVFLAVGLLGTKRAVACVVAYLLLGMAGVPVFSNFQGGAQVLFGQTGGFLVGFALSAFISGVLIRKLKDGFVTVFFAMFVGLLACYFCGVLWLLIGFSFDFKAAIILTAPLFAFDIVKIALAAALSIRLKKYVRYLK